MAYTTELIPNLNKLIASKNAIVAKLQAVGVAVPDGATLEQLSALIPSGGGGADAAVTVTAATLFNGETARDKDGNLIIGTALATTTTAGLYDVGKGKTYYDHYGVLRTGLGDFTPAEDVAAMQAQIDGFNQKLMQITADQDGVMDGYTAMGADGELFIGARKAKIVQVPYNSWQTPSGAGSKIVIPFGVTDAAIYVVGAKCTCYLSSGTSTSEHTTHTVVIPSMDVYVTYTSSGAAVASAPVVDDTGNLTLCMAASTYRQVKAITWGNAYCVKL